MPSFKVVIQRISSILRCSNVMQAKLGNKHAVCDTPPFSSSGMDRLVMLLTDNPAIQEVLLFPQMRPEKWD